MSVVDASFYCKVCDKTVVGELIGDHYSGEEHYKRIKVEDLIKGSISAPTESNQISASNENRGKLVKTDYEEVKLTLDAAWANSKADVRLLKKATIKRLNAASCRFCSVDFADRRTRRIHELSSHTLVAAALKTIENPHATQVLDEML